MAKKLGKVKKPSAKKFEKGRKLIFLPLIFSPEEPVPEFTKMLDEYWQQAQEQIKKLEGSLAKVSKIYHELISDKDEEGIKAIEEMDAGSKSIVMGCIDRGAEFYPAEERSLLSEFIDWSQCLSVGLMSRRALELVENFYNEVQEKRRDNIARVIDETLKGDEVGMLVMREGCDVQFPSDIQVFYIAPPKLDEVKKWFWDNRFQYEE